MRILILGGDGMLGHQLLKHFAGRHEARVTLRQDAYAYERYGIFGEQNSYFGIDIRSQARVLEVMADFRPEEVINAVGIVKQRPTAKESIPSLEINSLLPHRLAIMCKAAGMRLVHVSTDCVFSGRTGGYRTGDDRDAEDDYGFSKLLGEVAAAPGRCQASWTARPGWGWRSERSPGWSGSRRSRRPRPGTT